MSKLFLVFMFALNAYTPAFADTPPARSINSQTYDGSGQHAITATSNGGKEGLDVNIINPSGGNANSNIFDSSGNALNSTSNALNSYVTNFPSTFNVGNFPSSFGASQVGSWTVGATISNFPATQAVTQGTSPWVVSGTISSTTDNANSVLSAQQTVTTTESNLVAPTNAVGVIVECESPNPDNLRWGFSNSATNILSSTTGVLCEPGRDSGYLPLGAGNYLHLIATGGGSDFADVQWVLAQ